MVLIMTLKIAFDLLSVRVCLHRNWSCDYFSVPLVLTKNYFSENNICTKKEKKKKLDEFFVYRGKLHVINLL